MTPKPVTHVTATLADPCPAAGSMTLSQDGKLRVELDLDLAPLFARVMLAGKPTGEAAATIGQALSALITDLAPKFAQSFASRAAAAPAAGTETVQ